MSIKGTYRTETRLIYDYDVNRRQLSTQTCTIPDYLSLIILDINVS